MSKVETVVLKLGVLFPYVKLPPLDASAEPFLSFIFNICYDYLYTSLASYLFMCFSPLLDCESLRASSMS